MWVVIGALLCGSVLYAQSEGQNMPLFLRIGRRDADVRLVWMSGDDFSGSWGVYRYSERIAADNFDRATMLAIVPAGQDTYLDLIQEVGRYFYAVMALDQQRQPMAIFIPRQTVTTIAIPIAEADLVRSSAARVNNLSATARNGAIELRFTASMSDRTLLIFRSEMPIRTLSDVREAAEAGTAQSGASLFIDRPLPGIDFYYGVFDRELVDSYFANLAIVPGENSTEVAALLDIGDVADLPSRRDYPSRRSLPLPRLSGVTTTAESLLADELEALPPPAPTTRFVPPPARAPNTEREAARIRAPMILEIDRRLPSDERSRALRDILLSGAFQQGDWQLAILMLSNLLASGVPREVGERVHFYRGQALYFDGDYRTAILEFLLAGDRYAEQVRPWIDSAAFLLTT